MNKSDNITCNKIAYNVIESIQDLEILYSKIEYSDYNYTLVQAIKSRLMEIYNESSQEPNIHLSNIHKMMEECYKQDTTVSGFNIHYDFIETTEPRRALIPYNTWKK